MKDIVIDFFDPVAYLEAKRIPYFTEGPNTSPGWINLNCPWCGDNLQHLGINLNTNGCNCWRCGGKSIGKLVQLIENCSWSEALAMMEKYQNYSRSGLLEDHDYIPPKQISMPKEFIEINHRNIMFKENALLYSFLWMRGFKDPTIVIENHPIYYSDFDGTKYKFRLGIPIFIHKRLVSFMTRDVTDRATKPYIACSDRESVIPCKHTLYGYDEVTPGSVIVLIEGPIDQWKLGKGALATWGTGWTMEQVALLRSLSPEKIFVLYDSEEIAQEAAKRLQKAIWFCDTEVLYLENKKDPGELTLEEGKKLMKELTK